MTINVYTASILDHHEKKIELAYCGNENIVIVETDKEDIEKKIYLPRPFIELFLEMIKV